MIGRLVSIETGLAEARDAFVRKVGTAAVDAFKSVLKRAIFIGFDTPVYARPALKFPFDFFGSEGFFLLLGHGVLPVLTTGRYHPARTD